MPRQERAERTRLAILDAAAAEFDAHGYEGARLDRIIERTGATKGAVYFHFPSKLAIARALVEEKYGNWPVIIGEVTESGLRGLAAAEEITQRVGHVFATDVHVRAAMKLSQTVLPPPVDDNPYDRWVGLIAMFVRQGERSLTPKRVQDVVHLDGEEKHRSPSGCTHARRVRPAPSDATGTGAAQPPGGSFPGGSRLHCSVVKLLGAAAHTCCMRRPPERLGSSSRGLQTRGLFGRG